VHRPSGAVSLDGIAAPVAREAEPSPARWCVEEVQPHELALRGWLCGRYSAATDVDDIVQESYLRLLRARKTRKITCVRAYLFGIAHHVAMELFRRRRLFSTIPVNDLPAPRTIAASSDVVEAISIQEELALAAEAMKALPERCREIVVLRSLHGCTYQEIAARLGLAEETVRVQMARGVKKCAQFLRERGMNERGGP
jgi:RNA polymerase sigma-70 factor (ECF subfamily)